MVYFKNVGFYYDKQTNPILTNISLHIPKGEYISVLGENGSGKTTFIKLILKLEKPTSGMINCISTNIGYVPQKKTNRQNIPITVFEFLDAYRKLIKIKNKNRIDELLQQTDIQEKKHALVSTLSGGQLQRVLIARALIGNPDLLILDEPSSGIDLQGEQEIYALLKKLHTSGHTIISVEHNLQAALHNSTTLFHIAKGSIHPCSPNQYSAEFLNSISPKKELKKGKYHNA